MGAVYVAQQIRLERRVALKVIAPELADNREFRERFERESRVAASIDHPNVVPIYEAGEADGLLFIVMRLVPGTDLRARIAERGRIAPDEAAALIAQVAGALDAAHAIGLVHRDIKPGNILLERTSEGDRAYLSDFGLTKRISSASALTRTGMVIGTLDYIAPEQLQGDRVDARTDVYALACLLFHSLTGRVPFPRDDDMAKMYAHVHVPPPSLLDEVAGLPRDLGPVVARGMAKDPSERYQSAGDLGRAALAAVQGEAPTVAERSVATGAAAPTTVAASPHAAPPPPRHGPPPPPAEATYVPPPAPVASHHESPTASLPPQRSSAPLWALVGLLLVALGVGAALLVVSSGDDEDAPQSTSAAGTERTVTTTETTETTETGETTDGTLPPGGGGSGSGDPSLETFVSDAGGFSVDLPSGAGWTTPRERQVSPGLWEVSTTGPDGLEVLVNYTPDEPASIQPSDSCTPVDHPEFSLARKCTFRGGTIDVCQTSTCVDYLLNDSTGGPGYAVLVGGGSRAEVEDIAADVAASFVP